MFIEPITWTPFSSQEELLEYLKAHKLAPPKNAGPKPLYYENFLTGTVTPCTVVGYVDKWTTVISIDGQLHCIHPEYLEEMQKGKSKLDKQYKVKNLSETHTQEQISTALSNRYFVFDVETPNQQHNRISSIGFAILENGEIIDNGSYLVNPEVDFDHRNINITKITPDDVENAPTFPQIWDEIKSLAEDCIWVAHNAKFDLSVLKKVAQAYRIKLDPIDYLCTYELAKEYLPSVPEYGLEYLSSYFQIPLDHHQAESDSIACAEILNQLIESGAEVEKRISKYDFSTNSSSKNRMTSRYEALEESSFDVQKSDKLLPLFQQLASMGFQSDNCDNVIGIKGKLICLTGDFDRGSRAEISAILESQGAVIKKSVVKKLDYLIVGEQGSPDWKAGTYGTKVKKAMELQAAGAAVQIIREADLFAALEANI